MNVLQDSVAVVRRSDAEVLLHLGVPQSGKLLWLHLSRQKAALDVKPEEDVQVVSGLVRLDANQARLDRIDRPIELVHVHAAKRRREGRLELCKARLPEWARAADDILPEAGLRFVNAQRAGLTRWVAEFPGVEPLLVDAVSRLVHGAEEGGRKKILHVPRRQPDVVHRAVREGVRRLVEPSRFEVEAHLGDDLTTEGPLALRRIVAVKDRSVGALRRASQRVKQREKAAFEVGEYTPQLGFGHPRLVLVQQRVISARRLQPVRHFARQRDDLLQVGEERREIVFRARLFPGALRQRHGLRPLGHQPRRQFGLAVEESPGLADVGARGRVQRRI